MPTQILGTLAAVAGVLWFVFTLKEQPVWPLMGVVFSIGGLLLWALGRIECAVSPPEERSKRNGVLSLLLLFVILLAAASVGFLQALPSSPKPAQQGRIAD